MQVLWHQSECQQGHFEGAFLPLVPISNSDAKFKYVPLDSNPDHGANECSTSSTVAYVWVRLSVSAEALGQQSAPEQGSGEDSHPCSGQAEVGCRQPGSGCSQAAGY
jgi:hypothetical protein